MMMDYDKGWWWLWGLMMMDYDWWMMIDLHDYGNDEDRWW